MLSRGNNIYNLKHKFVCIDVFRNLRDLTNFYKSAPSDIALKCICVLKTLLQWPV